ncbi:MAG: hypothetical protein HQK77_19415 [Desulfobacterales bacterium]|nr:hypothetical protein [Desulfobacterales bacterium]
MPIIAIKAIKQQALAKAISTIERDKQGIVTKSDPLLTQFASHESICSIDVVINERLDNMAKAVNDYYAKRYNGSKWKDLTMFHKESSRANAEHINTKLYLLGLKAVETQNTATHEGVSKEKYEELLVENIELLSKVEHLRWNAFHYLNGWKYATERDNNKKFHNCLTEWDNLSEKDKQKDRDTLINIPQILEEGGYQLVKI